jgi:hypothetical protein
MSFLGALAKTARNVACMPLDVAGDMVASVATGGADRCDRASRRLDRLADDLDPDKRDVIDDLMDGGRNS